MNGKQVFRWATEKMPEVALEVLGKAGLGIADVDLFIPHQANMRINQLVAWRLELDQEKVVHNIESYGNTTAATIPMALDRAFQEDRVHEGMNVLFAAFGAGFTWAGAVLRL
jgi:3-oxoacyl-[acyl-carrier-protein] synthase III